MSNLSKDYHFYWDADSKSRSAYNAVTNQGKTAEFSRTVWNSLVDNLNEALHEVGLDWDSTYGTWLETRAMILYTSLTSDKFNAVRLNAGKYVNATWKWAYDRQFQGYTGREEMRGVNTHGEQAADTVYGSYILELVRKYNVFIDILDDEASFASFVTNLAASISTSQTELDKIPTLECSAEEALSVLFDTVLTVSRSYGLNSTLVDRTSSGNSHIELFEPFDCFKSNVRARTSYQATIELEDLCIEMTSFLMARLQNAANLAITSCKCLLHTEAVNYSISDALLEHALTCDMVSSLRSSTDQEAVLGLSIPLELIIHQINKGIVSANLIKDRPRYLIVDDTFRSIFDCEMENVTSRDLMCSLIGVFRYLRSALVTVEPQRMMVNSLARAVSGATGQVLDSYRIPITSISSAVEQEGTLDKRESLVISGGTEANETDDSTAVVKPLVTFGSAVSHSTNHIGTVREFPGISIGSVHSEAIDIVSSIIAARMTHIEGNSDSAFTIVSTLESYQESTPFFSTINDETTSDALLIIKQISDSLLVEHVSASTEEGTIDFCIPIGFSVEHLSKTEADAIVELRDAEDSIYSDEVLIEESSEAILERIMTVNFEVLVEGISEQESELSFDPSSWLNPVKENDKLFVYQVYRLEQEDETLYLDKEDDS